MNRVQEHDTGLLTTFAAMAHVEYDAAYPGEVWIHDGFSQSAMPLTRDLDDLIRMLLLVRRRLRAAGLETR